MMQASTNTNTTANCAACGKGEEEGGEALKTCISCKMAKYCNRECQLKHRPQHKKACKQRAAELHEIALFREPPPNRECPICLLPMPHEAMTDTLHACCGQRICDGCTYGMIFKSNQGKTLQEILRIAKTQPCPFCRSPPPSSEAVTEKIEKLATSGNADAYNQLAGDYCTGSNGLPQDMRKANELWLKAGELGCADAYYHLGIAYTRGRSVEIDKKKAQYYYELAAMKGHAYARYNLGCIEKERSTGSNILNIKRALKHLTISARAGHKMSMDRITENFILVQDSVSFFGDDHPLSKDNYESTLRSYQQRCDEMKSDTRDKAAALYSSQGESAMYNV